MSVREYELTIIIQPEISEEGTAAILERLDGILAERGAIRLLCHDQGKRKLAYEIQKFHKGHYHVLSFLDEGKSVPDLERALRLDESVLRFLTVKVSDLVTDIEGRRAEAKEREIELEKRAAEKAAREAEEAKARAEAENRAAEEARAAAESEAAGDESESADDDDVDDDDAAEADEAREPSDDDPDDADADDDDDDDEGEKS
jgi:small subunit ribosomal protein S6